MNTYTDTELVDKFLEETLTPEELAAFTHRIKTDSAFVQLLKDEMDINATLSTARTFQIHQPKVITLGRKMVYLAAASLGLFMVFVLLFILNRPKSTVQLFADNFIPYELTINDLRNEAQPQEQALNQQIVEAYAEQEYEKAIPNLQRAIEQKPQDHRLHLYLGNCHLALGQSKEAIEVFEGIINNLQYNTLFTVRARWYLALAYLRMDDVNKASKQLKMVVTNGGFKKEEAEALLDEL